VLGIIILILITVTTKTLVVCIVDNEVDWSVWSYLSDDEWHMMLPGKVGIVAKIKLLLKSSVCILFIAVICQCGFVVT